MALEPTSPDDLYNLACGHGVLVAALRKARPEPNEDEQRREAKHVAAAVATLRHSIAAGYSDCKQHGHPPRPSPAPRPAGVPNAALAVTEGSALERLVQLYAAWAKREEAANWRNGLEATKAADKKSPMEP